METSVSIRRKIFHLTRLVAAIAVGFITVDDVLIGPARKCVRG